MSGENGQLGGEGVSYFILAGENDNVSIEQAVNKLVSDYIGGPIYRFRPQGDVFPAVTYSMQGNDYQHQLTGKAGFAIAKFEFHIWSETYTDLAIIGGNIRQLLDAYSGAAWTREILVALHDDEFDEEVFIEGKTRPRYCRTQIYTISYLG